MSCDGNFELLMELEDFMEEVETIIDNPDYCSTSPPVSDWLVHFNPITKQTVYRHIVSGKEEQEMPTEYATYLEHFNQYMKRYSDTAIVNTVETDDSPVEQSNGDEASNRYPSPHQTTCLSGLINYSASESDSDSNPDGRMSPSPDVDSDGRVEDSESTKLIGPQLPKRLKVLQATDRQEDTPISANEVMEVSSPLAETHDSDTVHSPSGVALISPPPTSPLAKESTVPDSSCSGPSLSEEKLPTTKARKKKSKKEKKKKHKDKHSKSESRIEDTVEAIKDKFAAFNISNSDVSTLHCLYIQMTTRLEDWRCGKLSSRYVTKKFNELESRLSSVTNDDLPMNWTLHWDAKSQRYYYYNRESKVTQWTFPEHRSTSTPPAPKATIIRPPQLLLKNEAVVEPTPKCDTSTTTSNSSDVVDPLVTAETTLRSSCSPPPMVSTCHLPLNLPCVDDSAAISEVNSQSGSKDVLSTSQNEDWLNKQLQEFAIACLEFSSPTREDDTLNGNPLIDDLPPSTERQNQTTEHLSGNSSFPESRSSTRKKKTTSTTKGHANVGKGLPQLIQKWQRLQESL